MEIWPRCAKIIDSITGGSTRPPMNLEDQNMSMISGNQLAINKYFTYLEDYEVSKEVWLIQELLCNSLTLLSGQPKSGKSMLAAHMASSLITGNSILNCEPTTGVHKIGWIGFDANWKEETKNRLGDFGGRVICIEPPNNLTKDWNWEKIAETAKEHGCTLMIVDHLYGLSENLNLDHAHEANRVLQKIRHLYVQYELPTLLIAQAGKGSSGRAAHSVHLEGEARHLLQLDGRGASGLRTLKLIGNNSKGNSYKIQLRPDSCEIAIPEKEKIEIKVKRQRGEQMPDHARKLISLAGTSARSSASSLARFDVTQKITGRSTEDSSRTYINNLIRGGLLVKDRDAKLISAGPKLLSLSEVN